MLINKEIHILLTKSNINFQHILTYINLHLFAIKHKFYIIK